MMNRFLQSNTTTVSIQKSNYDNLNIESLLIPLGGFKNYINKGERVLLKTNLLTATGNTAWSEASSVRPAFLRTLFLCFATLIFSIWLIFLSAGAKSTSIPGCSHNILWHNVASG